MTWYCERCMHKDVCSIKESLDRDQDDAIDKDLCDHFLVIIFLCDKRDKCEKCYHDCYYTADISHAKNFQRVDHSPEGFWEEIIQEE